VKPTLQVDTRGFAAMALGLSRVGGVPIQRALDSETGAVLGVAVRYTRSPNRKAAPRRKSSTSAGNAILHVNQGIRAGSKPAGTVWLTEDSNGRTGKRKTHYVISGGDGRKRRWSNERWNKAQAMLAQVEAESGVTAKELQSGRKKKVTGFGLAKQTWTQIGDAMGIPVKAPQWVKKALPQDGRRRQSGTGSRKRQGATQFNEIQTWYPLLVTGGRKPSADTDGRRILQRAVKTRISAFKNALRHGVFTDLKARAAKYQGIFIRA
jgi:hypothetical protein